MNLSQNEIGVEGAKFLGEALAIHESITSINFYGNAIADEGARSIIKCIVPRGLKITTKISFLDLSCW